jgi:4,5-dihydroxyphthalate decarboxylase
VTEREARPVFRAAFANPRGTPRPSDLGSQPTRALRDGTVRSSHFELTFVDFDGLSEMYGRMVNDLAFDICEFSALTYLLARDMGIPIIAIPTFLDRRFMHYVAAYRTDSGIKVPKDLEGRRVGVTAWTVNATMWNRYVLQHAYEVDLKRVSWLTVQAPHIRQFQPPQNVTPAQPGHNAVSLLHARAIDAFSGMEVEELIGALPHLRHLVPDLEHAPRIHYEETGIYPPVNLVVISEATLNRYPWLAVELFRLLSSAKDSYLRTLRDAGPRTIGDYRLLTQQAIVGPDPLPFGVRPNLRTLEAWVRAAHEQGITSRLLDVDSLFAPGTLDLG